MTEPSSTPLRCFEQDAFEVRLANANPVTDGVLRRSRGHRRLAILKVDSKPEAIGSRPSHELHRIIARIRGLVARWRPMFDPVMGPDNQLLCRTTTTSSIRDETRRQQGHPFETDRRLCDPSGQSKRGPATMSHELPPAAQ